MIRSVLTMLLCVVIGTAAACGRISSTFLAHLDKRPEFTLSAQYQDGVVLLAITDYAKGLFQGECATPSECDDQITGMEFFRATDDPNGVYEFIGGANSFTFRDQGVSSGHSYFYRAVALREDQNEYSGVASVVLKD